MAVKPEQTIDTELYSLEDLSAFVDLTRGGAARRVEWTALVTQFRTMLYEFPHIIQTVLPGNKLVRARTISSNEVVDDVTKLGPPPPEKCKDAGRCNWVARPTAYFGVGEDLSLSEINARIGDRVGFLYAQPSREMHLLRLGAIDLHRRTSGMCDLPEHIKRDITDLPRDRQGIKVHLFDAFISDFFARKGNKDVYKVTSAFTQALFDTIPELDGILYDSVNHVRGACIAIRQESYAAMRPTEVRLVNVNADLGYGIYEYQEEAFSNTFDGISIKWAEATGSG